MNKIMLIAGLMLGSNAHAIDPNFDATSGVVSFPKVTVNNATVFVNVELLLRPDGTWAILAATEEVIEPVNNTYPLTTTADFSGHFFENLFFIDGRMWLITGATGNQSTGNGNKSLTIREGGSSLPASDWGVQSDLFMLVDGSSTTFFVKPLNPEPGLVSSGSAEFNSQGTDEIITLEDNSLWVVSGTQGFTMPSGFKNYTVYSTVDDIPNPSNGARSENFILFEDNEHTFFIKPL